MEEKNSLSVRLSVLPIPPLISTYEKKNLSVCLSDCNSDSYVKPYVDFWMTYEQVLRAFFSLPTIDKNCDLCLPYRTIDFGAPIFFCKNRF